MSPPWSDDETAAHAATADPPDDAYDSFLREAARVTDAAAVVAGRPLAVGPRLGRGPLAPTPRPGGGGAGGAGARGGGGAGPRGVAPGGGGGGSGGPPTLGQGGLGVVYAARDHVRGGEVALKTLQAATLDAVERLRGEFLVLHDLAHPNLVALGELIDDAGRWCFTMERVPGPDFLAYVRPGGVLDVAQLRAAAAQLATGLGVLHAAGAQVVTRATAVDAMTTVDAAVAEGQLPGARGGRADVPAHSRKAAGAARRAGRQCHVGPAA